MTARVQENRTATPNAPPANNSLNVGELYVEMADPLRLWTGVPTTVTASGVRLLIDVANQAQANASAVQKAGDTMTGPLVLSGQPTAPAQAASKSYVDTVGPTMAPVQSVAGRQGAVTLTHTDITDWTTAVTTALAPYAPLNSPVFTGTPSLPTGTSAVTQAPGTSNTSLATTAFATAADALRAPLASPVFTGDPQAPTPLSTDNDTSIATTAFVQTAVAAVGAAPAHNIGRNLIHNPLFNVAQRGAGPFTASSGAIIYHADRWMAATALAGDALTLSVVAHTDANRTAIGDEAAQSLLSAGFTGGGANSICDLIQRIENVRRLAGKTVTVSFWANASATLNFGVGFLQVFGTGGSPSAIVTTTLQAVTLSTTWARYSLTFAIPSVQGKTFGTNAGTDYLALTFYYSFQSNAAVGNQSGTINLWGVQLEIGNIATPLEKPDPRYDLSNCQRFFQLGNVQLSGYSPAAGFNNVIAIPFITAMRGTPTITPSWTTQTNGAGALAALNGLGLQVAVNATATGIVNVVGGYTASADL
jgi:hypothetical protein